MSELEDDDATELFTRPEDVDAPRGSVDVVYIRKTAFTTDPGRWRAVDVCTRNRIYGLDSELVCIAVVDRATGADSPKHRLLGSKLVGGQKTSSEGSTVSHPLPEIGFSAVFSIGEGPRATYIETSAVTRVIFRQRIIRIGPRDRAPTWDEMSGVHDPHRG